jgi:uncharacterized membrane protein YhaH (DUF805 family)
MARFLQRYFSFDGRLARLPLLIRILYLSIASWLVFLPSVPLFSSGTRAGYWSGLLFVAAWVILLCVGTVSLFVRRLHDLGLSGYHVVWVVAVQICSTVLSNGPPKVVLMGLPLALVGLWLMLWPGNKKANRFGEVPE